MHDSPSRIRLSRRRGWKMPRGAVIVDRRTDFGNPFYRCDSYGLIRYGPEHLARFGREWDYEGRISSDGNRHDMWFAKDDIVETHVRWGTPAEWVELFELTLTDPTPGMMAAAPSRQGRMARVTVDQIREKLAGKTLACWCPLDSPCHADVLLRMANAQDLERHV